MVILGMKRKKRLISRLGHGKGQGISKGKKMHWHILTRNVKLVGKKNNHSQVLGVGSFGVSWILLETTWNQARNETFKVHEMEQLY
jgi:hypothetical protein